MEINKSIKFLKNMIKARRIIFVDEDEKMAVQEYIVKFGKAIEEFKICVEYKKMWEEFKFKRGDTYAILEQPGKGTIRDDMDSFEEKYFPKENSEEGLSKLVDKVKEVINQTPFTCEEIAKRLTPKD